MAIYRQVQMSFWNDAKVVDDFTPEDRYFYLYLLTNPHTNLAGCYELSIKQASDETGYNRETIEKIIHRMEMQHGVIRYDKRTKEILVVNWSKFNWINSEKFRKPLYRDISMIKSKVFQDYLISKYNGEDDTVSIPYQYGSDTTVTVTVSDTVTDTVSVKEGGVRGGRKPKHKYGEYQHVLLTDDELQKLNDEHGPDTTEKAIRLLDEYIEQSGKKYKNHYLAMRNWVFNAVAERGQKKPFGYMHEKKQDRLGWMDDVIDSVGGMLNDSGRI